MNPRAQPTRPNTCYASSKTTPEPDSFTMNSSNRRPQTTSKRINELRHPEVHHQWIYHIEHTEGTVLPPDIYTDAIRHRLGCQFFPEATACHCCGKLLDVRCTHAGCCATARGRKRARLRRTGNHRSGQNGRPNHYTGGNLRRTPATATRRHHHQRSHRRQAGSHRRGHHLTGKTNAWRPNPILRQLQIRLVQTHHPK